MILLEGVDRLGKMGEVVIVADGFARNYLIPNNKAKPATSGNMKILELLKKKEAAEANKKLEEAKKIAEKIASLSLTITAQAGEEDKLFGSVSNDLIADALAEEGVILDKKDIILDEPIKKLGVYKVVVKLHPDLRESLKIWVVKK